MRLRAARNGVARRVPEDEVVRVVVRVTPGETAWLIMNAPNRSHGAAARSGRPMSFGQWIALANTSARRTLVAIAGKYQNRSARTVGRVMGMFETGKYETTIHTRATATIGLKSSGCGAPDFNVTGAGCSGAHPPHRRRATPTTRSGAHERESPRGRSPERRGGGDRLLRGRVVAGEVQREEHLAEPARVDAKSARDAQRDRRVDERVVERVVGERRLRVPAEACGVEAREPGFVAIDLVAELVRDRRGEEPAPQLDVEDERRHGRERRHRRPARRRRGSSG